MLSGFVFRDPIVDSSVCLFIAECADDFTDHGLFRLHGNHGPLYLRHPEMGVPAGYVHRLLHRGHTLPISHVGHGSEGIVVRAVLRCA